MNSSDTRFIALNHWLVDRLNIHAKLELIAGDASFRRYYRAKTADRTYILMDSPPELLPIQPFIDMAEAYKKSDVFVPEIIASNVSLGAILLSDLGDIQLLSVLDSTNVVNYYQQALGLLPRISSVTEVLSQTSQGKLQSLPLYNEEFIQRELGLFIEWFLEKHLGLALSNAERSLLAECFSLISKTILEQPVAGMHRDFHCRNLMLVEGELAVIDFQDAVIGPVTYDCVSLLKDCYIRWPYDLVLQLALFHYESCIQHGYISDSVSFEQYVRWFDFTGLQRHIKVLGIFSRLNYRDGKPAYMADIPLVLEYVLEITSKFPELSAFHQWMESTVLTAWKKAE